MARKKLKTAFVEKEVLEWHGAPDQLLRLIRGILSKIDEDYASASVGFNLEALVNYIVSVRVLYNNVEVLIKKKEEQEEIFSLFTYLEKKKWEILANNKLPMDEYIKILNLTNFLDRKLRSIMQDRRLLYLIKKDDEIIPMWKEVIQSSDKEELPDLLEAIPLLREYVEIEDDGEEESSDEVQEVDEEEHNPERELD